MTVYATPRISTIGSLTAASPQRRPLRRLLAGAVVASSAFVGAVGLLHMPFAAPLLRALSPASVCPVTRGTPEQVDRAHAMSAAAIRRSASSEAPLRPALGFELDRSRSSDIDRWAAKHDLACRSVGGNESLRRCKDVPAEAVGQPAHLGRLEEVSFELDGRGQLVNVQTMRRGLTPARAAEIAAELERRVASDVGAPSTVGGEPTAGHLSHGPLTTYVAEHVFTDYRATVSATNLASTGVMVREQYISARP